MIKYFSLLALMVLVGCSNNQNSKEQQNSDTTETKEPHVDPVSQEINTAFPYECHFFSSQDSSFTAAKFAEASNGVSDDPYLNLSDEVKDFEPYFLYNSDSSFAVDLYSYNILLEKENGKTVAEAAGPDTEVGLIDLKNKTRKRIYFGGTSSAVLDAKWINKQQFLLLTGEIIDKENFRPQVLKYTVTTNAMNEFVYADTLRVKFSEYRDKRFGSL
jgi:hypothetical protein